MSGVRLIVLVAVTMLAFAANSLLNRAALADGAIGPSAFAAIRVAAGAATLLMLAALQGGLRHPGGRDLRSAAALSLYMLGFSFAYVSLDAGFGALLLFGGVQVTMFAGAVLAREAMPARRWVGAAIAFAGLVLLLRPDPSVGADVRGMALMLCAAVGWGIYSLLGRGSAAPLGDTAQAFILCLPVTGLLVFAVPDTVDATAGGIGLAVLAGALTSGCGYALWYLVLPHLGASRAAVAQLTVPATATLGGVLFLAETPNVIMVVAGGLVLGGVALSLSPPRAAPRP